MSSNNPYQAPETQSEEAFGITASGEFPKTIRFLKFLSWLVPLSIVTVFVYLLYSPAMASALFGVTIPFSVFMSQPKNPKSRRVRHSQSS